MRKKVIIGIVALCFVFLFPFMTSASTAYATEETQNKNEYYVYNYGDKEIYYLLDEKKQPYYESNGERIYLALPLEHLKVTDEEFLAELNCSIKNTTLRTTSAYEPEDYHNLASEPFESTIYLSNDYTYTKILKMNPTKEVIRIKTSKEVKNHFFTGKKISYVVVYYSAVDETWFQYTVDDINCSNDVGSALDLTSGQLFPYVYYGVKKSSDLSSVTVTCWCTDV